MKHKEAAYSWRGVLIDESRHFLGKKKILEVLAIMNRLGYNRLHWHLSDDQGFRIALKNRPELTEISAKRPYTMEGFVKGKQVKDDKEYSYFYSESDIKEIVSYARSLGIEVVPEIDMPGHMNALLAAYPQYACGKGKVSVATSWGIFDHPLCIGNEKAVAFAKEIVSEVASLFGCRFFHLGFDEIKKDAYKHCPKCQAAMKAKGLRTEKQLVASFRHEMVAFLREKGIVPIVWNDEVTQQHDSFIVEAWKPFTTGKTKRLARKGQKLIIAPFFRTYACHPYCLVPLKRTYEFDPSLGLKDHSSIMGAEVAYWGEYYTESKFDFEFYYRAYAVAKTLWGDKARNYKSFRAGLAAEENDIFGKELSIPLSITDPKGMTRLKRLRRYMKKSTDAEYEDYLKSK